MVVRKDFVGLHRVGLADAHEDEVVKDAFRRQREVHDLGEVHLAPSPPSPSPIGWERGWGEGLNFPEIVDLALPAEGVFHNLVFVSIRKTYPMQAYKVLADGHPCTASGAWAR